MVVASPVSELNQSRGVTEPLGHRIARHLFGETPFEEQVALPYTAASLIEHAEQYGPTSLVVMADGSACRGEKAPGHLHPDAIPFDDAIDDALRTGDVDALGDDRPRPGPRALVRGSPRLPRPRRGGPWPTDHLGRELRRRAVRRGLVGRPLEPDLTHEKEHQHANTIEIPLPDGGVAEAYVSRPLEDSREHPGVLFYVDAIGLRPRIEEMTQRIADWGYVVLAPNVFHREGSTEDLEPRTT